MFPLADVRGKVLGFGARAMREEQRPKYLNTSDNDVYHKGLHLYGADLARAHATRAGEVIVCEGYTDAIALHQAGMRNAVGLMGTALTGEQVGELARMAQTVLLALDADSAGQEAMLRASSLAAKCKLELRVVPLPAGKDPAELIQREGAEAMRAAVARSIPFVRFRVERVLAAGDDSSPEGRDRMLDELRPVFATLAPSAMRMELTRIVSDRLELPESVAERLLAERASAGGGADGASRASSGGGGGRGIAARGRPAGGSVTRAGAMSGREETERAFLALCIASPEQGEAALAGLDVDEHFSSELLRRAARHLRAVGLSEPMSERSGAGGGSGAASGDPDGVAGDGGGADTDVGADGDDDLRRLLAELVVEAGRERARPAMLEVQRLQLELAGIDRQIQRARARQSGEVNELAGRRAVVKRDFDRANERVLEETGEREG